MLLVAGTVDSVIPVAHTVAAHDNLPGSRVEVFDATGHFPHAEHPHRFARLMLDFLNTTTPARADLNSLRRQLQAHRPQDADSPPLARPDRRA